MQTTKTIKAHKSRVSDEALTDPDSSAWADRLRFFRKKEVKTIDAIAKEYGTGKSTWSKYETGDRNIPIEVVIFMHTKYKMGYEWFFEGNGTRKTEGDDKSSLVSDIARIYQAQQALKSKVTAQQQQILNLVTDNKKLNDKLNEILMKNRG